MPTKTATAKAAGRSGTVNSGAANTGSGNPKPKPQTVRRQVPNQPVAAPTSAPPSTPVRRVDGLIVVSDEPLPSPLSQPGKVVAFQALRLITLEDGSTVIGCRDCEVTGSRGDVQRHRYHDHGAHRPGPKRRVLQPGGPLGLPPEQLTLTLGDLLKLAAERDQWADMVATMEATVEHWKGRAETAEMWKRRTTLRLERAGITFKDDD